VNIVKARENRQKVMIKARMRSHAAWHDVCILNLSVHGLGIQSASPPARGAVVEIRRGRQIVIARVAWAKGHRAGLRSQDPIFIRALVSNEDVEAPLPPPAAGRPVERRHTSRPTSKAHDDSRVRGRIIEFASFAIIVAALGIAAASTVGEALEQPLSAVRVALDPGPEQGPSESSGKS